METVCLFLQVLKPTALWTKLYYYAMLCYAILYYAMLCYGADTDQGEGAEAQHTVARFRHKLNLRQIDTSAKESEF